MSKAAERDDLPEWLERRVPFYLAGVQVDRFAARLRFKASFETDEESLRREADKMVREQIGNFPSEDSNDPNEPYDEQLESDMRSAARSYFDGLKETESYAWGLAIVGIFHLWERDLRDVLRKHLIESGATIERAKFDDLCCLVHRVGFEFRKSRLFPDLELAYLISNTIKHSDGSSSSKLFRQYPHLFRAGARLNTCVLVKRNLKLR